uniref:Uncharacterized protein n=1 Tax=Glossina pallidipes TaxID=7398 RepID=A0A1A9Z6S8_GLOPL
MSGHVVIVYQNELCTGAYDNINSCLSQLRSHAVAGLDNITTNDICCGRLKAVLALFFALSRYKQQSKQSKCVNNTNGFSIKAEIHQQPQTNTLSVSVGGGVSEKVSNSSATALLVQSMQNGNDTTMVNRQNNIRIHMSCIPNTQLLLGEHKKKYPEATTLRNKETNNIRFQISSFFNTAEQSGFETEPIV